MITLIEYVQQMTDKTVHTLVFGRRIDFEGLHTRILLLASRLKFGRIGILVAASMVFEQ